MLKKFDKEYNKIISEATDVKFNSLDELIENATDDVGLKDFTELKNNQIFMTKLKNTDKEILKEASEKIWDDFVEQSDDEKIKNTAKTFFNFLNEFK